MDLGINLRDDPPRRPPSLTRFGLPDALILVVATALGLLADRGLQSYPGWPGLSALFTPPDLG